MPREHQAVESVGPMGFETAHTTFETGCRSIGVETIATNENCANCSVRDNAVCGRLPVDALSELNAIGRHRTIRKGQTLIWEGDETPMVATVLSGMVKLSAGTSTGDEQILGLIGPSGFLGRPNGGTSEQSIVALVDTKLCVFPTGPFKRFMEVHPELGMALLDRAFDELDRARRWQIMLARASAAERMASLLMEFTGKDPVEGKFYSFPLSRGQMADLAGLTIETISRQLTRLKKAGIISLPSRNEFVVHDRRSLAAICGDVPRSGLH